VALRWFFFSSLAEAFFLSRRERYDWKAMGVSVCDLAGRTRSRFSSRCRSRRPLEDLAWANRLATISSIPGSRSCCSSPRAGVLLLLVSPRGAPRALVLGNHSVHHSSNDLKSSRRVPDRHVRQADGVVLFFRAHGYGSFSPRIVMATLTLNLLYQFWIHATWIPKLAGSNTSSYAVGPSRAPPRTRVPRRQLRRRAYHFRRLFGTYLEERDDLPCRYGFVQPLASYNPLYGRVLSMDRTGAHLAAARSFNAGARPSFHAAGWRPTVKAARPRNCAGARSSRNRRS